MHLEMALDMANDAGPTIIVMIQGLQTPVVVYPAIRIVTRPAFPRIRLLVFAILTQVTAGRNDLIDEAAICMGF